MWLTLGCVLGTSLSYAQDTVAPEVILMIDTSASMRGQIGGGPQAGPPSCPRVEDTRERALFGVTLEQAVRFDEPIMVPATRLDVVRRVLAGNLTSSAGAMDRMACVVQEVATPSRDIESRNQYQVVAGANSPEGREVIDRPLLGDPGQYGYDRIRPVACVPHCDAPTRVYMADGALPAEWKMADGILQQHGDAFRFGLMTLEDSPTDQRDWPSFRALETSFAEDTNDATIRMPAGLARSASLIPHLTGADTEVSDADLTRMSQRPNYGARGLGNGSIGDLIPGTMGVMNGGTPRHFTPVNANDNGLESHAEYVAHQVRRLTAYGHSPLTAFIHDLKHYYRAVNPEDVGPSDPILPDAKYRQRQHMAILITDGGESRMYGARNCLRANSGCPAGVGAPYADAATYISQLQQDVPSFQLIVIGIDMSAGDQQRFRNLLADRDDFFPVSSGDELRAALENALLRLKKTRSSLIPPMVIAVDQGDDVPDTVRQFRVTAYSEAAGGGRYGRMDAVAFGCEGDGGESGQMTPLANESIDFAVALTQQDERRSLTENPDDDDVLSVTGPGASLFNSQGRFNPVGAMTEGRFRDLVNVASDGDAQTVLTPVFEALEGFFGPAVLPDEEGQCVPACAPAGGKIRQLGELETGNMVAIIPPRLGIDSESVRAFRNAEKDRPSLVGVGSKDGQIHLFRVFDGREVLTFVPHRSWGSIREIHGAAGTERVRSDGPLMAREMVLCRSLGEGREGCPADEELIEFRTVLTGGIGQGGPNIFALDLTDASPYFRVDTQDQALAADALKAWNLIGLEDW